MDCFARSPTAEPQIRSPASLGPFTVDFICREAALVVEVDGATHSEDTDIAHDQARTAYLVSQGYRVLRVMNDDVYHRYNDVMDMILLALADELPPDEPAPSSALSGTFSRSRERGEIRVNLLSPPHRR